MEMYAYLVWLILAAGQLLRTHLMLIAIPKAGPSIPAVHKPVKPGWQKKKKEEQKEQSFSAKVNGLRNGFKAIGRVDTS